MGVICKKHNSGLIEINSWYKTGDVEQDFRKKFGLHVQIFCLQGKHWIQTSSTPELTLQQQSDMAKSSIQYNNPLPMKDEEHYI